MEEVTRLVEIDHGNFLLSEGTTIMRGPLIITAETTETTGPSTGPSAAEGGYLAGGGELEEQWEWCVNREDEPNAE